MFPGALHPRCINTWVSDGHVYIFHKVQPLAPSESGSGVETCSKLGGGRDGVGVEEGAGGTMISEGNDPAPSLLFSQSASRFCPLRARGGRAGGRERQVTPGARPAVAFPARPRPLRRCLAGGPPRTAEVGTWPGSSGPALGHGTSPFPAPLDVGAELGVQKRDPKPRPSPA